MAKIVFQVGKRFLTIENVQVDVSTDMNAVILNSMDSKINMQAVHDQITEFGNLTNFKGRDGSITVLQPEGTMCTGVKRWATVR